MFVLQWNADASGLPLNNKEELNDLNGKIQQYNAIKHQWEIMGRNNGSEVFYTLS